MVTWQTCQGAEIFKGEIFTFRNCLKVLPTISWVAKKILSSRSSKMPIFVNFRIKKCTRLSFSLFWQVIELQYLWYIFYSKNKLGVRDHVSIILSIFLREPSYVLFYTGKIPQTLLLYLVSLENYLFLLHHNVCIGDLSFICV